MYNNANIGVLGYGKIGKAIVKYLITNNYRIKLYNRTKPQVIIQNVKYTNRIENVIKQSNILFNVLPDTVFHKKLSNIKITGSTLLSLSPDLKISEIRKYCNDDTNVQRIITSTAIQNGKNLILSTDFKTNILRTLFPEARIIHINEKMLTLGTILLSTSAISSLIIGHVKNEVINNGFPLKKANIISSLIPKEIELLYETWHNNYTKVFEKSATRGGITESLGKNIFNDIDIKEILERTEK